MSSFAGGACSAISLNGTGGTSGTSGILQNNRVTLSYPTVGGEQYAYNIGTPNGVIYENNIASGALRSLSFDGGDGINYIIRGNIFYCPANAWALVIGAGLNGIIENNLIELTATNSTGLLMSGATTPFPGVTNCIVRNNTFINRLQATNNNAIAFQATTDWPRHCTFENNRIDVSLKFAKITSSAGFWFNNTDFDGNNLSGLSAIQTSRNVVANKP